GIRVFHVTGVQTCALPICTAEEAAARVDALRAGCVPLNPFGHAASAEAIAYAWDDLIEYTYTTQRVLSGTVSGILFDGIGAGPARIATGIDWREDITDNQVGGDPNLYVRTDFSAQYGDPWTGGIEVGDIFAEFEMPLLRDKPAAEYMMINLEIGRASWRERGEVAASARRRET